MINEDGVVIPELKGSEQTDDNGGDVATVTIHDDVDQSPPEQIVFETEILKILKIKLHEDVGTTELLFVMASVEQGDGSNEDPPGLGHGGNEGGGDEDEDEQGAPVTDMTDLGLLLVEHEKAVVKEKLAFKGIETFDDLLAMPEKTRAPRMKAIQTVLADVAGRSRALWTAIARVRPPPGKQDVDGCALMEKARKAAAFADDHLPDEFKYVPTHEGASNPLDDRLSTRLQAMEDPQGKDKRIDKLKQGFVDEGGEDVTAAIGQAYGRVIEPATLEPMGQARFYFDRLYTAQDPNKKPKDGGLSANEATAILVTQCQRILDNGGRFADVEELLKKTGIPKDWWPDKLVAEMQAWRKTEAAMQRQHLADRWEKDNPDGKLKVSAENPVTLDDLKEILQDYAGTGASDAQQILNLIDSNPEFATKLQQGLGMFSGATDVLGGMMQLSTTLSQSDDGLEHTEQAERNETIDKGVEVVSAFCNTLAGVYDIIAQSGLPEAAKAFFENQLIPGVTLAKVGVDLVQTGKALVEHYGQRRTTGDLKDVGRQESGEGSREGGEGLDRALANDQHAMTKMMSKDGIKLFTGVLDGAGELASTFGGPHGKAAGLGMSVGTTVITVGTKAVFTGIDWSEAKRAREMLEEARAGNPVAKVEIFKNSNLYAKMYIVLLAKDGDKLAEQFIVSKGISEENLTKSVSDKIMTQALLKASGQQSEEEISESLLEAMTGPLAALYEMARDSSRFRATNEYAPNWTGPDPRLSRSSYDETKTAAIQAGLVNIPTGIGPALASLETLLGKANPLMAKPPGKEARQAVLAAQAQLGTLGALISKAASITAPLDKAGKKDRNGTSRPHAGMTAYLALLLTKTRDERARLDEWLITSGLKNIDWTPPNKGALRDPAVWRVNWRDASEKACLPEQDAGMGQALDGMAEALLAFDDAKTKDGKTRRLAAVALAASFETLAGSMETCRAMAGQVPAMQQYLMDILKDAAPAHRQAKDSINPDAWSPKTALPTPITAAAWQDAYKDAIAEGYADPKTAYQEVGTQLTALDQAERAVLFARDQKSVVAAQKIHAVTITLLDKALKPIGAVLPALTAKINDAITLARDTQKGFVEGRKVAKFAPAPGLTGANWMATYTAAVQAGAVTTADPLAAKLRDGLDKADKSWGVFLPLATKAPFQKAREQAIKTHKRLESAVGLIETVMGWPGYEQPLMKAYLKKDLKGALETDRVKNDLMKKALGGTLADFKIQPPVDVTAGEFKTAVQTAVRDGVATDTKRDPWLFVSLLQSDCSALAQMKTRPEVPQTTKEERRGMVMDTAARLRYQLAKLKEGSENVNWTAYVTACEKWLEAQVETAKTN